jgi:pimeloyl-ACP methyl ester carboxylesterase
MSIDVRHSHVTLSNSTLHLVELGPKDAPPIIFLHGWPEDWSAWTSVMAFAARDYRCLAIDLPGVGSSTLITPRADKFFLARVLHNAIEELGLRDVTLVGHDIGGMIVFGYLKQFTDLHRAVIMNTVIPGIEPWDQVLANPHIWHFAFHSIPKLPELLVKNNLQAYFDYFYEAISAKKDAIGGDARHRYVSSYSTESALAQGFEFYRSFRNDAEDNRREKSPIFTPTLYIRGSREGGNIDDYRDGLTDSGLQGLSVELINDAGHFAPEESPVGVWAAISAHMV